jgi:hypothetical protein
MIQQCVDGLNSTAKIILSYHILCCSTRRYNLSKQLKDMIKKIDELPEYSYKIIYESKVHTNVNITDIYYNINLNTKNGDIKLNVAGYNPSNPPPRLINMFTYYFNLRNIFPNQFIIIPNTSAYVPNSRRGGYYEKYIKYKIKYINLKKQIYN